jgi:hypothetical protein
LAFYNASMRSIALLVEMDKEKLLGGEELREEEVRTVRDFLGEQGISERQRSNRCREWGMPLSVIAVSRGVPLTMSRTRPENLDPEISERSVDADVLFRQEPDEEEEEDEGDGQEDDDDNSDGYSE